MYWSHRSVRKSPGRGGDTTVSQHGGQLQGQSAIQDHRDQVGGGQSKAAGERGSGRWSPAAVCWLCQQYLLAGRLTHTLSLAPPLSLSFSLPPSLSLFLSPSLPLSPSLSLFLSPSFSPSLSVCLRLWWSHIVPQSACSEIPSASISR